MANIKERNINISDFVSSKGSLSDGKIIWDRMINRFFLFRWGQQANPAKPVWGTKPQLLHDQSGENSSVIVIVCRTNPRRLSIVFCTNNILSGHICNIRLHSYDNSSKMSL